jgi:hypothetical protein
VTLAWWHRDGGLAAGPGRGIVWRRQHFDGGLMGGLCNSGVVVLLLWWQHCGISATVVLFFVIVVLYLWLYCFGCLL